MIIRNLQLSTELSLFVWDQYRLGARVFAFDYETTGLDRNDKVISGAITGDGKTVGFFGPEMLRELTMLPKDITLVAHNLPFELKMSAWNGHDLRGLYDLKDTMILAHLLDENQDLGLGDLVKLHYNDDYKKAFWSKYKKATDAPEDELIKYNAQDVIYTWKLYHYFMCKLTDDGIPQALIEHVHNTQMSMMDTMIRGLRVDLEYLIQKGVDLKTGIERLLPAMRELVKDEVETIELEKWVDLLGKYKTEKGRANAKRPEFSFDSTQQLIALLYGKLGLPVQINEKTKNASVDYDSLEKIKDLHPIVTQLQEYREKQKIYGTYIQGILERQVDGRIYPSFNVCGTATGRISHQNPNMGNMPAGGGIRGVFAPDQDEVWVSADYSSLEVYVEAHFTKDKNLMRLITEGISKHDLTAQEINVPRPTAKTVNFLAQYHGTAHKLSKVLGITFHQAQAILDKYWEAYGGCKALKKHTDSLVNEGKPIVNPFGRKRRFAVVNDRKEWSSDYRQAYNALIQGTGSDCTSRAMWMVDAELKRLGIGRALFSVHDEILIAVKKEHAETAQQLLVEAMVEAGRYAKLSVDLKAEPCIMQERWEE